MIYDARWEIFECKLLCSQNRKRYRRYRGIYDTFGKLETVDSDHVSKDLTSQMTYFRFMTMKP